MSVVLALMVAAACGGGGGAAPTATPTGEPTIREIEVKLGGRPSRIEPSTILVEMGETVVFVLTPIDENQHSFTSAALNLDITVPPGGETVRTDPITFVKKGYIFVFCRHHAASGGQGTISVIE